MTKWFFSPIRTPAVVSVTYLTSSVFQQILTTEFTEQAAKDLDKLYPMYPPESYVGDHKTWLRERIYRDPEFTNIVKGSCGMEKLTSCYAMIRCVTVSFHEWWYLVKIFDMYMKGQVSGCKVSPLESVKTFLP